MAELNDLTVVRLRELAEEHDVDLTGLVLKDDIVDALREGGVQAPDDEQDEDESVEGEGPDGVVPDITEVPDPTVVEYGAESEPKTGKAAEQAVEEAEASQVAATEAQDEAFADDPPRHVAATKVTNLQTPTGMVQRVDELAEEQPTESGYETRSVGSGG
jgi:hypothetical protein